MNDVSANSMSQGIAFVNADECRVWLEGQPITSTVQMQSGLQRQLGLLNRSVMPAIDRLAILEAMREQIYRTQEECQIRFARRPVPLALPEQAAFDASQGTWQALADGYVRCLESLLMGEVAVSSRAAVIVQRILVTMVDMQSDMYRASQMPTSNHWHGMNQCFVAAEQLDVGDVPVKDRLRSADASLTPNSLFIESMLLHMAIPTEVGARQMAWLVRWSRRWSKKVTLIAEAPAEIKSALIYVVLDRDAPATHVLPEGGQIRIFDTVELRRSLKKRLHLLSQGETPASLQLGEDCTLPAAGVLLEKTYQRWCKNVAHPRRHERKSQGGECFVICGFEKAQTVFGGSVDSNHDSADLARLRREREQMNTLGAAVETAKPKGGDGSGEKWLILDQSACGLHIIRPFARGQQRIAIGMLIAVSFDQNQQEHLLATVRWTLVREDDSIEIGIEVLPGAPLPVMLSGKTKGSNVAARDRAFLLPAVPALKESSTLVIPPGWFEPGRMIELNDGSKQNIRLGQPLERGKDFERVTFSEAVAEVAA